MTINWPHSSTSTARVCSHKGRWHGKNMIVPSEHYEKVMMVEDRGNQAAVDYCC